MSIQKQSSVDTACSALAAAIEHLVKAAIEATVAENTTGSARRDAPMVHGCTDQTVKHHDNSFDAIAPSSRRIYVYMAGCGGLRALVRLRGLKIMAALGLEQTPYVVKCGTTTLDLATRLRQVGQDRYGAAIRTDKGIKVEPGYTAWIAHAISTSRPPRDRTITLLPRALAVDLPTGITRRVFDTALHRALKSRALTSVRSAKVPRRFVAYDLVETRISAATELYALCPHETADGDLLLDAIEGILERFRTASV